MGWFLLGFASVALVLGLGTWIYRFERGRYPWQP